MVERSFRVLIDPGMIAAARSVPELSDLVKRFDEAAADALAESGTVETARQRWASDDLEIDDFPMTSRGEDGCWISAWVWVAD